MALTQVTGPYPIFTDLDGSPLDDGYLYIGAANQDPETNPIQVFWDSALTIPATQPIRTNNGYAWRNGTPGLLYTAGEFSITIRNKRNEFVLYSPLGYGFDPKSVSASVVKNDFVGDGVEVDFTLSASPSTKLATNIFINGVYQEKDSYSLSGNVISFSIAPPLSSSIEILTNETGVINSGNANDISYTLTAPGATLQSVQTKLEQYVSVKDFGAVGDGVADDTAAIQAAIDAAPSGGCVLLNEGMYLTSARLNISKPLTFEGEGYGSVLKSVSGGTHIIVLVEEPSFLALNGVRLSNFRVDANGGGQLDAGVIALNNAVGAVAEKLWIENATRVSGTSGVNGISCSIGNVGGVGPEVVIRDCYLKTTSKAAINYTSGSVSGVITGNHIQDISGNGFAPGIQVNGGANCKIIGNYISNTEGVGIYVGVNNLGDQPSQTVIESNTIIGCGASSATEGSGILVTSVSPSTGRIVIGDNAISDCGTNTNGGSGIYLINTQDVAITGNICYNNAYDGVRILNSNYISITGNRCSGNNRAGASYAGGISFLGTCSNVSITGNNLSDSKSVKTQSYAILYQTGAVLSYFTIIGNHVDNNVIGPLFGYTCPVPMRMEMDFYQSTTQGTPSSLYEFALADTCAMQLQAYVIATQSDYSNRAMYSREALFYRTSGGSATQQGVTTTLGTDIESNALWGGVTLDAWNSGAYHNARIIVSGLTATNINWRTKVVIQTL